MLAIGDDFRRRLADRSARPMAVLSHLFLVLIAAAIQRVAGPIYREQPFAPGPEEIRLFWIGLVCLWPVFLVEFVVAVLAWDRRGGFWRTHGSGLLVCLFPPLRLAARSRTMANRVWLPGLGWQEVNRQLRQRLERFFSARMIVVALMILPVLVLEHFFARHVDPAKSVWLVLWLDVSTAVIWLAFTTEFLIMLSVADNKLKYCKEHWIDLAIIVLPLIAFARALRLARAVRLGSLGRMGRLYRLRGLAMKAYRAVLLLEVFQRFLPVSPERQLKRLRETLIQKEAEIAELRWAIAQLESKAAAQAERAVSSGAGRLHHESRPIE